MKIYQETHGNFCRNFCKKIGMHMGSTSKEKGAHSKKIQEKPTEA